MIHFRAAIMIAISILIGSAEAETAENLRAAVKQKQTELQQTQHDLGTSEAQAEALENRVEAAERELDAIREQLVVAGRSERQNESDLAALNDALRGLAEEEQTKRDAFAASNQDLAKMLGALTDFARHPPEALIALPVPPITTARTALLLDETVPLIRTMAMALQIDLADLAKVRTEIVRQKHLIEETSGRIGEQRRNLATLLKRKEALENTTISDAAHEKERSVQLASSADSLKTLVDRLMVEAQAEDLRQEKLRDNERARNAARASFGNNNALKEAVIDHNHGRTFPVTGKILTNFGQENGFGVIARGLTIAPLSSSVNDRGVPEAAIVVAPARGRVLFTGPFRGYGQILILEHGQGFHSLIAGLDHVNAIVGEQVVVGEPVATALSSLDHPGLYFELRHDGQPVNPEPWLAAGQN